MQNKNKKSPIAKSNVNKKTKKILAEKKVKKPSKTKIQRKSKALNVKQRQIKKSFGFILNDSEELFNFQKTISKKILGKKENSTQRVKKIKQHFWDFTMSKHLKKSRLYKILIIGVIIIAIILGSIFWSNREQAPEYSTVKVKRDTLIQTVNETGIIQPSGRIDLNFLNIGRITEILVNVGDVVKKDQILAKLDYNNLLIEEKKAKANLAAQIAGLNKLLAGATREEIAVSNSAVEQAQANYNTAKTELAEFKLAAQENIKQSKTTLDNLKEKNQNNVTAHEQAVNVAETALANTKETYGKAIRNYLDISLTVIEADLATINTTLDNIKTILDNNDIKDTFSARDTSFLINTKQNYYLATDYYKKTKASLEDAKINNYYEDISLTLKKTILTIETVFSALNNGYNALEHTVISSTFSQAQLDSFKTILANQLTLISAAKLEIKNITQNLDQAILNYKTQVKAAEVNLAQVQTNLDDAYLVAQNNYNTIKLSSQKQIALAESRLTSTKKALDVVIAQLNQVKAPPRITDIDLKKAQISQVQATLDAINNNIEGSIIKAPRDGTIIKVNYDIGEQNLINNPIISMLFNNDLEIEVDISETDIIKINKGDKAEVTLDAFGDDLIFNGIVTFIEPAETLIQDVVYYKVKISLDTKNLITKKIKPGMSANVTIITDKKENVLIVPYRAIVNRNGEGEFVRILNSENIMSEVPFKSGMRGDGGNIEALAGVKEGDTVVTYIKK